MSRRVEEMIEDYPLVGTLCFISMDTRKRHYETSNY